MLEGDCFAVFLAGHCVKHLFLKGVVLMGQALICFVELEKLNFERIKCSINAFRVNLSLLVANYGSRLSSAVVI